MALAGLGRLGARALPRGLSARTFASAGEVTINFSPETFETHRIETPPLSTTTTKEEMLSYYRTMVLLRRMEMEADKLYKAKFIRGFCHLYIGQEAVALGLEESITKDDAQITTYRDHCQQYLRGDTLEAVYAELMGRKTGCSKGKGGSMHMYYDNFYGGNGIVGAQVPVGAGVALAMKQQGKKNVVHVMYGDGAANQGQIFEAMNMAKLWSLPAIFICENNKFGMGTSSERAASNVEYYKRGDVIPGIKVDGMDVYAVRTAAKYAKDFCVAGNGPIVLEMNTYRYVGHSMSDPGTTYRTRSDVEAVRQARDAIAGLKKRVIDNGFATDAELKEMEKDVRKEIEAAAAAAKTGAIPDISETFTDIYVDPPKFLRDAELNTSLGL